MKLNFFIIILFLGFSSFAVPQPEISVEAYIDMYKDLAIEEMKDHHIPASITLAQGIHESNCGNSPLAREANNHFGIKCHKEWTGKTFYQDDDEKNECFRKYVKVEDSYRDHSDFLATRDRYNFLFDLEITDYKGWAYGLKQAGYATNPRYPELLIRIIEENKLDVFDKKTEDRSQKSGNETNEQKNSITKKSEPNNFKSRLKTQNSKLLTGPPEIFDLAGKGGNNRIIFINNGVKFIYAREDDDIQKLAAEFGIYSWQIYDYNELTRNEKLIAGQKVYLVKKKKKAEFDYHIVKNGEDLKSIAQLYGIRMNSLCRLNRMKKVDKVRIGESLILR